MFCIFIFCFTTSYSTYVHLFVINLLTYNKYIMKLACVIKFSAIYKIDDYMDVRMLYTDKIITCIIFINW